MPRPSLDSARGLVIDGGCVRAVVKVPDSITMRFGLVASSAADEVERDGVRQDFADLAEAFRGMPQRTHAEAFAWSNDTTLARGLGLGPTVWVSREGVLRKLTLATKVVADVALLADGTAYAGLGFFGNPGKGALARLDLDTGALTPVPLASVEAIAPLEASTLLVLRYDTAKRVSCIDKVPTTGPVVQVVCVPGASPRVPTLRLSSDAKYVAFDVGARTATTHVIDLVTGRPNQQLRDLGAWHARVSRSGALAVQDVLGPGPIVVARNGVATKTTIPGVLAGYTEQDELLVLDEAALKAGRTCSVTFTVPAP